MKRSGRLVGLLIAGIVLVAGMFLVLKWDVTPLEKLATAEKAVHEARAAGAASLFPQEFANLESLLAQGKSEMETQNTKIGFLRNYAKANELLDSVIAEGRRLTDEAIKRGEQIKVDAMQAQQAAQETVMLAEDLLEEAPGGKDRAALAMIKAEVQLLGESLKEIQTTLESHDYPAAQAKAEKTRRSAERLNAELRRAIEKVKPPPAPK